MGQNGVPRPIQNQDHHPLRRAVESCCAEVPRRVFGGSASAVQGFPVVRYKESRDASGVGGVANVRWPWRVPINKFILCSHDECMAIIAGGAQKYCHAAGTRTRPALHRAVPATETLCNRNDDGGSEQWHCADRGIPCRSA